MANNYAQQATEAGQSGRDRISQLIGRRQRFMDQTDQENRAKSAEQEMESKSSGFVPMLSAGGSIGAMVGGAPGAAIGAGIGGLAGLIGGYASGGKPLDPKYLFTGRNAMALLPMAQSMASAGLFQQGAGGAPDMGLGDSGMGTSPGQATAPKLGGDFSGGGAPGGYQAGGYRVPILPGIY